MNRDKHLLSLRLAFKIRVEIDIAIPKSHPLLRLKFRMGTRMKISMRKKMSMRVNPSLNADVLERED